LFVTATFVMYTIGSDYGYAWPDTIQMKGSVCHSKGVGLASWMSNWPTAL